MTVDRAMFAFTGDESFIENTSAWGAYAKLYNTGIGIQSSVNSPETICSHLRRNAGGGWPSLEPGLFMTAGGTYIGLGFDGSIADLKSYLANQYSMNQPLQVVAFLATPFEIPLTPQQIQTLVGENVVWSDAGAIDLTYTTGGEVTRILV
jgi:hypothetical protein